MSGTENKLLKQCTKKYAGYFKLNGKMVNTAVFVDKFLQKVCFLGIRISKISHISGQLMMLSILMSGVAICLSLASGDTLFQIIPYYLMSILGLYLYFSISGIVDIQEKKKVLKANLIDYLENHFAPRLEIEKENALEEGMKKGRKLPCGMFPPSRIGRIVFCQLMNSNSRYFGRAQRSLSTTSSSLSMGRRMAKRDSAMS